jgi:predicted transcriptional regulator
MTTAQAYIPLQLDRLVGRERQLATMIYRDGGATAKELEARLVPRISNPAVRSMLMRLVRKHVLIRKHGARGRGQEFLYLPAITPEHIQINALRQVSEQYFDGCLLSAALTILEILEADGASTEAFRSEIRDRRERRAA